MRSKVVSFMLSATHVRGHWFLVVCVMCIIQVACLINIVTGENDEQAGIID